MTLKSDYIIKGEHQFPIIFNNLKSNFSYWLDKANERIFSIAAGNRIGKLAPVVMRLGLGKILYAANELGVDIDSATCFVVFAPDGTITYNQRRLQRGFSYGCIVKTDFDGMIATPNTMPNGCGFSIYKLEDDMTDKQRNIHIEIKQKDLGKAHIDQLSLGNHFAAVYQAKDPISGGNLDDRFGIVHCSGHVGTEKLYETSNWLADEDGYDRVETPHGPIVFLDGEAKKVYLKQYENGDTHNTNNRTEVMNDVFGENNFTTLEEITHQGFSDNGSLHKIGVQIHSGLQPIAFNPEEGLIAVTAKPNFTKQFLDHWEYKQQVDNLGYEKELTNLNFTPHGGGYEMRYPIKECTLNLNHLGISNFNISLDQAENSNISLNGESFRDIRSYMTFRRKLPIMKEVFRADLLKIIYDLIPLKQIYPLESIPGGKN